MKKLTDNQKDQQGLASPPDGLTESFDTHDNHDTGSELLSMFSKAIEQNPVSIVITNLEGTIEYVNPKFVEITGYSRNEAIGQNPSILKTSMTPPAVHKELWETISSGRAWEGEFINKKKNGEIFIEQAKITPFKNSSEQITHYLAFKEDITARKRVENELQLLNASLLGRIDEETRRRIEHERLLANQARLVAMGEMVGAIAHQWRQPLATLAIIIQRMHAVGCAQSLTREQLGEFKDNTMRQIKYMSDTIEEFSGFYRKDKNTELFSPHDCIIDAIKLLETQFTNSNIHVTIRTNGHMEQQAPGFPNEFKQVILNLLNNAHDAIIDSRKTSGRPFKGSIDFDISIDDSRKMIIDISDNGIGIPEKIANRIFDPYYTTKGEFGGSGLGLYMSRMIMQESLSGVLKLHKSSDGAVFRIKLPLEELP